MVQGEKGKKIKGINAVRDSNSGAVIFNDSSAYQRARKQRRAGTLINNQKESIKSQDKTIRENEKRIDKLEKEIDKILKFMQPKGNGNNVN